MRNAVIFQCMFFFLKVINYIYSSSLIIKKKKFFSSSNIAYLFKLICLSKNSSINLHHNLISFQEVRWFHTLVTLLLAVCMNYTPWTIVLGCKTPIHLSKSHHMSVVIMWRNNCQSPLDRKQVKCRNRQDMNSARTAVFRSLWFTYCILSYIMLREEYFI